MSHIATPTIAPGTAGRPLSVVTNSFVLTMPKKPLEFFHYDITINPSVASRGRRLEIVDRLQTRTLPEVFRRRAAYDGKNMFSLSELNLTHETVIVNMSNRTPRPGSTAGQYQVSIRLVARNNTSSLQKVLNGGPHDGDSLLTLQLLNLLLRQAPIMKYPHNARSFYLPNGALTMNAWEIWPGVFMSARPSIGKMLVNIDITSAVMYRQGPLISVCLEFLRQILRRNPNVRDLANLDANSLRRLKDFLKRLRIETDEGKKLRIEGIEPRAGRYRFGRRNPDGSEDEMTVEEYFRTIKSKPLKHPEIPGVKHKSAVFPFELCTVLPGQFYKKAPPPDITAAAMEKTKMRPSRRLDEIRGRFTHLDFVNSDYVRHTGLEVSIQPETVDGRLPQAPGVQYGNGSRTIEQGAWNMRGVQLLRPQTLRMWSVVSFDPALTQEDVIRFVTSLIKCMRQIGITVEQERPPLIKGNAAGDNIRQKVVDASNMANGGSQDRPHLLIFIIPTAAELYRDLKYIGDTVLDVPTQCVRSEKAQDVLRKQPNQADQYYNNLALKINGKLGGINCKASNDTMRWFSSVPSMVIGIDVSHPGPGVQRPSFVSVVSSVDASACQYYASTGIQHPRQEIANDLREMMITALRKFNEFNKNKVWPERIFIFRDGVSEGEYHQVAREEDDQIRTAIRIVWEKTGMFQHEVPVPKITFIIVGKRHHVRFIPKSEAGGDRSGNVPAGFVADTGITSPGLFNFYLQSHAGILGTSRSGHYVVLKDENGLDADTCQNFAFALCHVYAPATRSVSIPAPIYYAHRLCRRADIHLKEALDNVLDDQSTTTESEFNLNKWQEGFRPACRIQSTSMHFL